NDSTRRIGHDHVDMPVRKVALRMRPACHQQPSRRRTAKCGQQFPPSDDDCHTPLPSEVRKGTIPRHEAAVFTLKEGCTGALLHSQKMNACHQCPRLRRPYRASRSKKCNGIAHGLGCAVTVQNRDLAKTVFLASSMTVAA